MNNTSPRFPRPKKDSLLKMMPPIWVFVILFLLFALLFVSIEFNKDDYRVNTTDSTPQGIYRVAPGSPGKGDFVMFCLEGDFAELAKERGYVKAGSCSNGLRPLCKILVGLPGDAVDTSKLSFCMVDSKGRAVPSILEDGVIPEGFALVLTEHPGSFDGRYFGLVPLNSLVRVVPVYIFGSKGEGNAKP